jgi:hypothetical protein
MANQYHYLVLRPEIAQYSRCQMQVQNYSIFTEIDGATVMSKDDISKSLYDDQPLTLKPFWSIE